MRCRSGVAAGLTLALTALVGCKGVLGIDEGVPVDQEDSGAVPETSVTDSGRAVDTGRADGGDAGADAGEDDSAVVDSRVADTGSPTVDSGPPICNFDDEASLFDDKCVFGP